MPKVLSPIPVDVQIVEPQGGTITTFFRLAWEALRSSFQLAPSVAVFSKVAQTAALPTTTLFTTLQAGLYRVSWYLRVTGPDGVSSAVQVTIGWTETLPLTRAGANVTGDTITSLDTGSVLLQVDAPTNLTIATSYASNTPNQMVYEVFASVEQLA